MEPKLTGTTTVLVTVMAVNEHTPQFNEPYIISVSTLFAVLLVYIEMKLDYVFLFRQNTSAVQRVVALFHYSK